MRIKLGNGLAIINALSLIFFATFVLFHSNILGLIIGIPLVLFTPGYSLLVFLFPVNSHLKLSERIVLSFILSAALVILLLLGLNYTDWGITPNTSAISIVLLVLLFSIAA